VAVPIAWVGDRVASIAGRVSNVARGLVEEARRAPEEIAQLFDLVVNDPVLRTPVDDPMFIPNLIGGINPRERLADMAAVIKDPAIRARLYDNTIPIEERLEIARKALAP